MKCPKCGFNSFEYYNACKKCSNDLTGYKQTYSITSLVLPSEAKEKLAAEYRSTESTSEDMHDSPESHDDIFSFDLPDDSPSSSSNSDSDPFSFDEPAPAVHQPAHLKSEEDAFADLLESTSQTDDSPFSAQAAAAQPVAAAQPAAPSTSGPGEFDLESFSWEDPPAVSDTTAPEAADDFDSLFGDTKENSSK